MQITNSFWLAENTKETTKNQSKFKKMATIFRKRRFDFVRKATIEKLFKEIFLKLEHSKKYIFLAKCIENVVVREKYCQQNRGKWARETKKKKLLITDYSKVKK